MARARVFASLADVCGAREIAFDADTLGGFLDAAADRYGEAFSRQLSHCRVLVNEEPVDPASQGDMRVTDDDEIAILPPVSGGQPDG